MARPIAPVLVLMLVVLVALVLARKPPPPMPPTREMTGAPGTIDPSARRPNFKIKDRLANMKSADSQTKLQACTDTCRSRNDEHLYCTWECAGASACGATVLYSYRNSFPETIQEQLKLKRLIGRPNLMFLSHVDRAKIQENVIACMNAAAAAAAAADADGDQAKPSSEPEQKAREIHIEMHDEL